MKKIEAIISDVDVLLLFKKKISHEAAGLVQEIFYPLWDVGLDVSYVTRSLKECSTLAQRDFEVLTSLIDARFVCGISSLYSDLSEALDGNVLRRRGQAYVSCSQKEIRADTLASAILLIFWNQTLKTGSAACETITPCSGPHGLYAISMNRETWKSRDTSVAMSLSTCPTRSPLSERLEAGYTI